MLGGSRTGSVRKAQLRAESLAAYYAQLQQTRTVASPHVTVSVVSHPDNFGCLDHTSTVSETHRQLTVERETVNTTQVQSDLNELSAQEAVHKRLMF